MKATCLEIMRAVLGEPAARRSAEVLYHCPRHDDRSPSLSLNPAKDCWLCGPCGESGNAWQLAAFLAGCDPGDKGRVKVWLQERGLLGDGGKRIVAVYPYQSETGEVLYEKVRYEPKTFRHRRPDGKGGFTYNLDGIPPTLYNLPEVLKAKSLLFVEGEKDVETARKLGVVATTSGAVGSWKPEFARFLKGKRVAVIADADEPGRRHARQVATDLFGVAESVRILDLMQYGKDLSEYVGDGTSPLRDRNSLMGLVKAAKELTAADVAAWKVQGTGKESEGFRLVALHDLLAEPDEQVSWILDGRLPASGFSMLAGKPKAGKSTLARCLALAVAGGESFLGWETAQGPVLYLALEEKRSEVRAHFRAMGASGDEPIFIHAASAPQDALPALTEIVGQHKPKLIIVDPLLKLARLRSEKDYAEVSAALEPLLALARESGAHLLAVYHSPKVERADLIDSPLGSTAFAAAVDTLLVLKRSDKYRTLATVQRYGTDLPETVLDFEPESRNLSLGAERADAEQGRIAGAILEYLTGCHEPQTEPEITDAVEGKTAWKRGALRDLFKAGKVERTGKGSKGNPFSYSCSQHISGTREQECEKPNETHINKGRILVPDVSDYQEEDPGSWEQEFSPSEDPQWGEV